MLSIYKVSDDFEKLDIIRRLFLEYSKELDENLCFQSFDNELEDPRKKYGEPQGCLLIAYYNDNPVGCIALQPLQQKGVCEMKRLYVQPEYRNKHVGNELVKSLLKEAKEKGYKKMVLDTLERLQPAIRLYKKFGFENTGAYYANPLPHVVYLQKAL